MKFNDVTSLNTVPMYSCAKIPKHGRPTWPNEYVWNLFCCIQLYDKENLTFVECRDEILFNSS